MADRLRGVTVPWYVAGGWALDLYRGVESREHEDLEIGVPEKKLITIPLGIEGPEGPPDRKRGRAILKLPPDAFVVGTLARLVPDKRVEMLIRACAASKEFKKRGFLAIGGEGSERARLEPLAAQLLPDQHRFLGRIDDTGVLYSAIDLFCLVSELEGFGLVFVEAGAYGVPSIACDTGGTRYAIQDGETGLLIPVDEPMELTPKLDFLMQDHDIRKMMGEKAAALARKNYSLEKMAKAYEAALGLTPVR